MIKYCLSVMAKSMILHFGVHEDQAGLKALYLTALLATIMLTLKATGGVVFDYY